MIIQFDRFELDTEQKSVSGPDGPVSLRPQTLAVLCYLIDKAPAVVSRDELLDAVWGHQSTSASSVAQTIKELRHALGDSSSKPHLIATRRRLGYQFIGEIHAQEDPESSESPAVSPESSAAAMPVVRFWPWPTLAVIIAGIAAVLFWGVEDPVDVPTGERMPTLAVAQMVNASDDPALDWLGPALESYLGHALVELGGFRVLNVDPLALDDQTELANIDLVIEGRYLSAGVGGSRLLASVRSPDSGSLITSVEASLDTWNVADLTLSAASAIRDQLGYSSPPDVDPSLIRSRLPRTASSQRAYFVAVEAIGRNAANRALREIERAREQDPDNPRLDHIEALAYKQLGDWQAARQSIENALAATRLWPRRDRLGLEATAALLEFDYERAVDRLQALTEFFPDPSSTRRLIEALIETGRLGAAEEALQSAWLHYPKDPRLGLLSARLAQAENDHERRLAAAREAVVMAREANLETLLPAGILTEAGALIELGRLDDAHEVVNGLLSMTELIGDADRAMAQLTLARIQFQQGELPLAIASAEQARSLFEKIPHPAGEAEALMVAGAVEDRSGNIEASLSTLEQAVERFEELGDKRRLARSNIQLGIALTRARRTELAIERLEQGARYFRAVGDRQGEGAALLNQATVLARSGRLEDAEPLFQRGLEAFVDAGDLRGQAIALGNLAAIAATRRDMTRSIELSEQALGMFETLGAETDIARVSYNLALIHRRRGDLPSAEQRIEQAGDAFASQGAVLMQSRALTTLGTLLIDMGRFDELEEILVKIDALDIQDPVESATIHAVRGERDLVEGRIESALIEFEAARDLLTSTDAESQLLVARFNLARAALAGGQSIAAEQAARDLIFAFGEVRQVNNRVDALLLLAEALIEQNRIQDALASLSEAEEVLSDSPDTEQQLRLALLRSLSSQQESGLERLEWVAETAGRYGFRILQKQAEEALAHHSSSL